ncbi:MAG: alpha/beta fold hydrolase [Alphaproteobacteria bacterium]
MASPRFADARLANGLRLRYAEQGEADGPVVLMLHGYTDSWFSFSRLLPLVPERWRVIAPSHRGHDESDKPVDGYTVDNLATDALQFMDALGLARAHIIGHSMGAFIAPRMAAYAPARVSTLVLIGTAPSLRNDAILGLWDEIKALGDTVDPAYARTFQTSMVTRAVPAGFMERAIAESLKLPAHAWKAICQDFANDAAPAHLAKVQCPTLVLGGDHDIAFSVAEHEALAELIPDARLKIYPNVGHSPHWEVPEEVAADIAAFIGENA